MTERMSLDRELTAYLEGRSTNRATAGLLETSLARVDATRQRPAWLLVGRRLAAQRPYFWTPPVSARVVLVVILLAALVIGAIVAAGSQKRLPPPFGLARSGALVVEFGGHIGIMRPDGTGLSVLTSGPEIDSDPTWSPDGTRFAFTSYQEASYALIVMDADGGHRITLADGLLEGVWIGGGVAFGPAIWISWSPDSHRIAFSARIGDALEQQHLRHGCQPPRSNQDRRIRRLRGVSELVSGRLHDRVQEDRSVLRRPARFSLWLVGADGSSPHQLSATTGTREALTGTAWSPDGARLAFLAPGTDLHNDIFVINADGTGERDITQSLEDEFWPSWSPDGTRIAFSRVQEGSTSLGTGLFVVDADGTNLVPVITGTAGVSTILWSPDGSRILGYVDGGFGGADSIAVLDPTGRKPPVEIPLPGAGSASWQRLAP